MVILEIQIEYVAIAEGKSEQPVAFQPQLAGERCLNSRRGCWEKQSKPCHLKAHAQACCGHHDIGGCEHGDAGLGCHREMKRVQAAQPMLGITRDQMCRL